MITLTKPESWKKNTTAPYPCWTVVVTTDHAGKSPSYARWKNGHFMVLAVVVVVAAGNSSAGVKLVLPSRKSLKKW